MHPALYRSERRNVPMEAAATTPQSACLFTAPLPDSVCSTTASHVRLSGVTVLLTNHHCRVKVARSRAAKLRLCSLDFCNLTRRLLLLKSAGWSMQPLSDEAYRPRCPVSPESRRLCSETPRPRGPKFQRPGWQYFAALNNRGKPEDGEKTQEFTS
jgi:hypothetical protein